MGRSPCCAKIGLKKGPWTPEEDKKLLAYIEEHGHGSWRALPIKAGLQRCGKSCRLRWTNYLRPDIKRGKFSVQEEQNIIQLHALLGNRWSAIATHLSKRTDNEIKNYWNTHLKKRLAKMGIDPVTHKPKNDTILTSTDGGQSKNAANLSHMAQWENARLEAEARLVRQSKLKSSSSNSFQAQKPQFASNSSPIHKPVDPTRCLDVLKAWNGWGNATEAPNASVSAVGIGGELGSPTSTLSSSVCDGGTMKQVQKYREGFGNSIPVFSTETSSFQSTWATESVTGGNCSDHVPCGNFAENFTDLLLSTSSADRRSEDGGESSDNGGGSDNYFGDNKNYWDSILNLVNSSPPDSPIF